MPEETPKAQGPNWEQRINEELAAVRQDVLQIKNTIDKPAVVPPAPVAALAEKPAGLWESFLGLLGFGADENEES